MMGDITSYRGHRNPLMGYTKCSSSIVALAWDWRDQLCELDHVERFPVASLIQPDTQVVS